MFAVRHTRVFFAAALLLLLAGSPPAPRAVAGTKVTASQRQRKPRFGGVHSTVRGLRVRSGDLRRARAREARQKQPRQRGSRVRDARAYLKARGMSGRVTRKNLKRTEARIRAEERRRARSMDRRLTKPIMRAANRRFAQGQTLRMPRQRVLYGFSHLVDRKVNGADAIQVLQTASDKTAYAAYLARGPKANGTWGKGGVMDDASEVLAATVYHQLHGEGKAKQFSITRRLQRELETVWAELSGKDDPGGAALFGNNISASYREVDVTFHSAETPSKVQTPLYAKRSKIVTRETGPEGKSVAEVAVPDGPTKINYILEMPARSEMVVHGQRIRSGDYHRMVLSSQATYHPTFDPRMSNKQLAALARANDVFVGVGLHYLTGLAPGKMKTQAARLRRQLEVMRKANPELYVHYSYVSPRNGDLEAGLFDALDGQVDSIDLNSAELRQLARNLDGRTVGGRTVEMPGIVDRGGDVENPAKVYRLARALMEATNVERFRVHARWFDVALVRTDVTKKGAKKRMEREDLASMHARSTTTNKVANPNGRIMSRRDRWNVVESLPAEAMVEVRKMVDHLARTRGLTKREQTELMKTGVLLSKKRGGVSIALTPAREFYDFTGGLISAGDTLGITALNAVGPDLLRPLPNE